MICSIYGKHSDTHRDERQTFRHVRSLFSKRHRLCLPPPCPPHCVVGHYSNIDRPSTKSRILPSIAEAVSKSLHSEPCASLATSRVRRRWCARSMTMRRRRQSAPALPPSLAPDRHPHRNSLAQVLPPVTMATGKTGLTSAPSERPRITAALVSLKRK